MVSNAGVAAVGAVVVVAAAAAVEIGVAVGVAVDERALGACSVSLRMELRLRGCSLRTDGMQMRKSWVRWVFACCGGQEVYRMVNRGFPESCSPLGCA